jgi:carbon monoxide dehydrogenase subunit G
MKITASYDFDEAAPAVWAALTDPETLARCIPGCEGLNPVGNDEYQAVLTVGVGPIRGRYDATISMRDQVLHQSYRLAVQGTGGGGFVNGEAVITLVEQGGKTTVTVESDSQAGGPVARVGQRLMESVAKMMMDKFFGRLRKAAHEAAGSGQPG